MATAISWFLYVLTGLLLVPVIVFSVQVFCAAAPGSRRRTALASHRPVLAILVPAHDEATGILETCEALSEHLASGDRIVVIADNCSDETADFARKAGVEVIERHDRSRRGKGYALDFGIKHLATHPPQVLVVVDADCRLAHGALDYLARACGTAGRAVQATYIMRNRADPPLRLRIAEFAGIVKNLVRPLGYRRLGLPCMLMGTGMAFPWPVISRANLATGQIVEDMKLGIDLTSQGAPPLFCPEAEVISFFPDSAQGFHTQRTRWEHGHLGLILAEAPRLAVTAIRRRNGAQMAMALDLAVPPLALLALLVALSALASAIPAILWGATGPLWASCIVLALLCIAVAVAWASFGRSVISFVQLAFAPIYALLKIPVYFRFVLARQVDWVRSSRKDE